MAFDPSRFLIRVKGGREYLQVKYRLLWFREVHPDWGIETRCVEFDLERGMAMFHATICDEEGNLRSSGSKMETARDFGDYAEKAETGAVGRALGMLGFGTEFAPEFDEGEHIVDSPRGIPNEIAAKPVPRPVTPPTRPPVTPRPVTTPDTPPREQSLVLINKYAKSKAGLTESDTVTIILGVANEKVPQGVAKLESISQVSAEALSKWADWFMDKYTTGQMILQRFYKYIPQKEELNLTGEVNDGQG